MKPRKFDLRRYAPPGLELAMEGQMLFGGLLLSLLFSLSFLFRYSENYNDLYYWKEGTERVRVWIEGAIMPDFVVILGHALTGFWITATVMLSLIAVHYGYHHQGSKSVYLMRRLPDRWERHRRCLTLPILAALLALACGFVMLHLYFLLYMSVTPEQCLTPCQWRKIWRELL